MLVVAASWFSWYSVVCVRSDVCAVASAVEKAHSSAASFWTSTCVHESYNGQKQLNVKMYTDYSTRSWRVAWRKKTTLQKWREAPDRTANNQCSRRLAYPLEMISVRNVSGVTSHALLVSCILHVHVERHQLNAVTTKTQDLSVASLLPVR